MNELKSVNKFFFKYKNTLLRGVVITIVAQVFMVFSPQFVGDSIDVIKSYLGGGLERESAFSLLRNNFFLIILFTLVSGFFSFLMRQTLIVMSRNIEFDLKNDVFKHYESLSLHFFKNQRVGDLMSRISEDVGKVRMYVGPAVMYSLNTIVRMTVVLFQMFYISPILSIYALIPVPFLMLVMVKVVSLVKKRSFEHQVVLSDLSSFSQETFSGIRVVKSYALEENFERDYDEKTTHSNKVFMSLVSVSALIGPLMVGLIGLSNVIVLYFGAKMYLEGSIDGIGVIAQFILYVNLLTWPIASFGWISSMIQEADAAQKRINEFMNVKAHIKNSQKPLAFSFSNVISFKSVCFTYQDTGIQALRNVSFDVLKGETIAVIGATGSGKSTLLELLVRLYDVDSGSIKFDGVDVRDINTQELRKHIAVVPQDAFLFSDSIYNNIIYGVDDVSKEEVDQVAKIAAIHKDVISFADGYETVLGERGVTLSGGQKQRVSIARALMKKSDVLIFDDSLSAVDTETEEEILLNLKAETESKTVFIITHRLSTAKNVDKIIVLRDGAVVEFGTHGQLLDLKGYYQSLYEKQLDDKK